MYTDLGSVKLKNGEILECGRVDAPDVSWRPIIEVFLSHKGPDWMPQISASLNGALDNLATAFYVGRIDTQLACQTMVAGDRRVGIVSHVYTAPSHQRKGAITTLLAKTFDNCKSKYDILTLGTEYESVAYSIYERLGFRGVGPKSGEMVWESGDIIITGDSSAAYIRPVRWDDWGFFNWLALRPESADDDVPRSPSLGLIGQGSVELAFLKLRAESQENTDIQALALDDAVGNTSGWAILQPGRGSNSWTLDVYAQSPGDITKLLERVSFPSEPVSIYVSQPDGDRARTLQKFGFVHSEFVPTSIQEHATCKGFFKMTRKASKFK